MRRIYYRYPQRVDLSFAMGMTFPETLKYISDLNGQESTKTTGKELVRIRVKVEIATNGRNSAISLRMSCAPESSLNLPISGSRCLRSLSAGPAKSLLQMMFFSYDSRIRTPALILTSQGRILGKD